MRYNEQDPEPVAALWVVNPDGRVIDVPEDCDQAEYAQGNKNGWRLATEAQVEEAQAEREALNKVALEKQAKLKATRDSAKNLTVAARELAKEEGGASAPPALVVDEKPKKKRRSRK